MSISPKRKPDGGEVRYQYTSIPHRRKCPVQVIAFTHPVLELGTWVYQKLVLFTIIINIFIMNIYLPGTMLSAFHVLFLLMLSASLKCNYLLFHIL